MQCITTFETLNNNNNKISVYVIKQAKSTYLQSVALNSIMEMILYGKHCRTKR